jgi:hypothetical protein
MKRFDVIQSSTLYASFIWMCLRIVPEPDEELAIASWIDGFYKEFHASQTEWRSSQIFNYGELFDQPDPYEWISPPWIHRARTIAGRLCNLLDKLPPIFPKVNRTKSVSRETAELYSQRYPGTDLNQVSTRDLEVHKALHGEEIGGPCEMRIAWKFNDLKPRVYYAQGGHDYHAAKYMKPVAVAIMEAFEVTSLKNRNDPTHALNQYFWPDAWVTTWDLSSFTTNLSELKYFIYWIARLLEEDQCRPLTLLDYADGYFQCNIWDLLDDYNLKVNVHSEFSIYRILDRFGLEEDRTHFRQQNSGMLGVPGNIGLSTALHGVIAAKAVGPEHAVCVGDDAVAISQHAPEDAIIPLITSLGSIAIEKFAVLQPRGEGFMKFLKRRLSRSDESGLWLSYLFSIPLFVTIDGTCPPLRTPPIRFAPRDRVFATVTHIGKLLWDCMEFAYLLEEEADMILLRTFLSTAYHFLGLKAKGHMPGQFHRFDQDTSFIMNFAVPPIDFSLYDPRLEDWAEVLFASNSDRIFSLPRYVPYQIPIDLYVGAAGECTRHRELKVLEDLGCIDYVDEWEMLEAYSQDNLRRFRLWLKRDKSASGEFRVCTYRVKKDLPRWFVDLHVGPTPDWIRHDSRNTM